MTTHEAFVAVRKDGRSDRQVVYETVKDAPPETVFGYIDLIRVLQDGVDDVVDKPRVYAAVAQANGTLLREQSRYLRVVRGRGYRVLRGDEHLPMSLVSKARAERNLRRGIALLRNVRLDEMTANQQAAHQGQLMVLSGLYGAVKESERRQNAQERVIQDLIQRVSKIEGTT